MLGKCMCAHACSVFLVLYLVWHSFPIDSPVFMTWDLIITVHMCVLIKCNVFLSWIISCLTSWHNFLQLNICSHAEPRWRRVGSYHYSLYPLTMCHHNLSCSAFFSRLVSRRLNVVTLLVVHDIHSKTSQVNDSLSPLYTYSQIDCIIVSHARKKILIRKV